MSIECFVFRPSAGSPGSYRFVTLPKVGEDINLPDDQKRYRVLGVCHMARKPKDDCKPTVQIHLALLRSPRYRLARIFPRRQSLPPSWRR